MGGISARAAQRSGQSLLCPFESALKASGVVVSVYPLLTIIIIHRITPQPPLATAFHISATMYASAVNMNRFQEQH